MEMNDFPPKPISRRVFLKTLGVSTAALTLAACAPRLASPSRLEKGKVQLVYQDCRCRGEQLLLQKFTETHPNIEVFYTPDPENFEEKMLADLEAGTAPDVMAGCCDFFPVWAQKGYLLDLRPYVQADLDSKTISDWNAAQYNSFFSANGMQYALPKYHGGLALFYNRDLFDKYNVPYPDRSWSHDDYLNAMGILTRETTLDTHIDQWGSTLDISWERIQVHVNAWGGHLVDPKDNTRSQMASPESLAAMEWLRARIWDDHIMASPLDILKVEPRQAFIDQRVAMVEEGSWALKDIIDNAPFQIGVAPFPAGPARKVTLATTDGFAIYAGTQHPDAAWEFLKFLISEEYGLAMAEAELLQPARSSLVDEWVKIILEQYPQATGIDLTAFAEGQQQGYAVTAEIFANMGDALKLTRAAWEQIYTLGQAPVDIMKDVSAQIEQLQLSTG
jgi:multiple sugar transport system substrate-binding protein